MSIHYGYRRSVPFAFGVSAADIFIVFLMLTVLKNVNMYDVLHNVWVASISGVVIIVMGLYTFRKSGKIPDAKHRNKIQEKIPRRRTILIHGFFLNIINPLIWIYWVSVIALISGEMKISTGDMYLFFAGVLGTTLALDVLKCKLASLLHRIITEHILTIFNKVTGSILMMFAIYLVVSMLIFQLNPDYKLNDATSQTEIIKKVHSNIPTLGESRSKRLR